MQTNKNERKKKQRGNKYFCYLQQKLRVTYQVRIVNERLTENIQMFL